MNINGDVWYTLGFDEVAWSPAQYTPREGSYAYEIIESGPYLILSNSHGIHRSVDLGQHWNRIYQPDEGVVFDMLSTPTALYAALRK